MSLGPRTVALGMAAALLGPVLLLGGCGGGDDAAPAATREAATETAAKAPAGNPATPAATPTATPTATATATEPASRTNPLPAVLADTGGVTGKACTQPENRDRLCVEPQSNDVTVRSGLAVFGVSSTSGGGFGAVYGRTAGGEWKPWFRSQNPFSLLFLPGEVRVCADGDGLNVRTQPSLSGPVVTTLADSTVARAEEFILDTPAASGTARGFGWYRLTAPVEGWAHSEFLAAAAMGDCATRDAQVGAAVTATASASARAGTVTATPTAGGR